MKSIELTKLKNIFFLSFILLMSFTGQSQNTIDFTLKYNSSLNRYEVFARPNFTQTNFTWGPSQISVVTPASVADDVLPNLTSFNAGQWGDNSKIYAPTAQPQNDFHGVESGGALTNFVANQELLIFSFTIPGGCLPGLRLFNNGIDPDSSQPGMGGGDFSMTVDNGNITDVYNTNYNNNGTNCLNAVDDNPNPISGIAGVTNIINVFGNDTSNGNPINPSDVVLSELNPNPTDPLTLNPNGTVDVAPNTPAGTYTLTYQICEVINSTNCDTAVVTVTVLASPIIANDDTAISPVNSINGQNNIINIYSNDTLNGGSFLPTAVNYSVIIPFSSTNITVDTNGNVSAAPNTPAGTYTSTYQICEALNPTNCDTAIITLVVEVSPIVANDDTPTTPTNGTTGGTGVINVLTNDTLNGNPTSLTNVTLTEVNPNPNDPLTLNPNGTIDVAPNTPAGTYQLTYQICEILNPTNCDTAVVTVTVLASPIIANDDTAISPVNSINGQNNIINIYSNDTLNGGSFLPMAVNYSVIIPFSSTNITVDTNGNVSVAPNTPAGTYTSTYQICEALNPTNCDTAIISVIVEAATIVANDDIPLTAVNGTDGVIGIINVFTNDTLNGNPVNPINVILTEVNPNPNDPLTLNPNGTVDVAPNTPAGSYTLTYQICEILNPTNCDTAIVTITVLVRNIAIKALLQGSLFGTSNGIMRDDLRLNNVIPLTEPYTAFGTTNSKYNRPDLSQNEQTTNAVLSITGNNAIVDWVFIELRDPLNNAIVLHTKAALIQRDGDIVESIDGISPLRFSGLNRSSYFISIKHRNHLGTMTNNPISFVNNELTFDFTSSAPNLVWNQTAVYQGLEQVLDASGNYALWAGNSNNDNKVKYTGPNNDQALIFSTVINHPSNQLFQNYNFDFVLPVYSNGDINMDAKVKYRGLLNDSNFIFFNVISKYTLNSSNKLYNFDIFNEQIPN